MVKNTVKIVSFKTQHSNVNVTSTPSTKHKCIQCSAFNVKISDVLHIIIVTDAVVPPCIFYSPNLYGHKWHFSQLMMSTVTEYIGLNGPSKCPIFHCIMLPLALFCNP